MRLPVLLGLALIGAGCDRGPSEAELARRDRLRAEATDPAVIDALSDPILADRGLSAQDDSLRVRSTPGPVLLLSPPTDGQTRAPSLARCDGAFAAGPEWAERLPAGLPVYPGARVAEAAGRDAPGCRVRSVRFTARAAPGAVLGFYQARARSAGYTTVREAREGETLLSGVGPGAFLLALKPAREGTEAGLIVNLAPPAP